MRGIHITKALKTYPSKGLKEIYLLNPWQSDPNYIEAGREFQIPLSPCLHRVRESQPLLLLADVDGGRDQMSRNFELIDQIERERSFPVEQSSVSAFAEMRKAGERNDHGEWTGDEALAIVQRIFLLQEQDSPRMVVFAGVDHRNGSSRICASVAEALARNAPGSVCLLEANFRSPGLPSLFGSTNHYGFTDALLGEDPIRSFAKPVGVDKLWLISSGALAVDSPTLLTVQRVKSRLAELRAEFDFVIVDAPPLSLYADAITLGQLSNGIVLVLEAEATRRETARAVVESLRSSGIQILGAVLNKRTFPIPQKLYDRL